MAWGKGRQNRRLAKQLHALGVGNGARPLTVQYPALAVLRQVSPKVWAALVCWVFLWSLAAGALGFCWGVVSFPGAALTARVVWRRRAGGAPYALRDAIDDAFRWAVVAHQWPLIADRAKLHKDTWSKAPLRIRRVRVLAGGSVAFVVFCGLRAVTPRQVQSAYSVLAAATGAVDLTFTEQRPGRFGVGKRVEVLCHFKDRLERPVLWEDVPCGAPGQLSYGVRQDGRPAVVDRRLSVLISGISGSGKSNTLWALLGNMVVVGEPTLLLLSNTKMGEFARFRDQLDPEDQRCLRAVAYETSVAGTERMLKTMVRIMKEREAARAERGINTLEPSEEFPWVHGVVDEGVDIKSLFKSGADSLPGTIQRQGRTALVSLMLLSQVSEKEEVKIRDMFPERIAHAVPRSPQQTDMALGADAAAMGAGCHTLTDKQKGMGWSFGETAMGPEAFRAPLMTDRDRDLISRSRVPLRVKQAELARMGCWFVYYVPDRAGVPDRYIGFTNNLQRRYGEHRLDSPWFPDAAPLSAWRYETVRSEKAARELERREVAARKPPWNDLLNRDNPHRVRWVRRGGRRVRAEEQPAELAEVLVDGRMLPYVPVEAPDFPPLLDGDDGAAA